MDKRHIKNFKLAIKSVEETPPEAFNMSTWGRVSRYAPCGTVACALGRAAMQPWAHDQGLYLVHEWIHENIDPLKAPEAMQYDNNNWKTYFEIDGKHTSAYATAEYLFGDMRYEIYAYLFAPREAMARSKEEQVKVMRKWLSKQVQTT